MLSERKARIGVASSGLKRNSVVEGTVSGVRIYGVFIDITPELAGLLHISQISYDRVINMEEIFQVGQKVKVMVMDHDKLTNRVALSTKVLEPNPGDMLRDSAMVYANAEETARKYLERVEEDRKVRELDAQKIVAGLGGAMDGGSADNLVNVVDSIENILSSIVSDLPALADADAVVEEK